MKRIASIGLLFLFFYSGFAQINSGYEYKTRSTPGIKKQKLIGARFISEIMPAFAERFILPGNDHFRFTKLLKLEESPGGNYIYPQKYFYHQESYEKIMEYISIEISTTVNGKSLIAASTGNALTAEQKKILNAADLGSDINIKIRFKYKYQTAEFPEPEGTIHEGKYSAVVLPEKEAEYPGGAKQITNYLNKNVVSKISKTFTYEKMQKAILIFTINEDGKISNTKISRTSTDPDLDKLLIDVINKMPNWKPAKDANGIKVKQEYTFLFGGEGC